MQTVANLARIAANQASARRMFFGITRGNHSHFLAVDKRPQILYIKATTAAQAAKDRQTMYSPKTTIAALNHRLKDLRFGLCVTVPKYGAHKKTVITNNKQKTTGVNKQWITQ